MNDGLRGAAPWVMVSAALAASLVLSGCGNDLDAPESEAQDSAAQETPPLDEPTEEPTTQAETAESPTEEAQSTPAGTSEDSEVLDVSEFTAESQESSGFPDLLTEVPEEADMLLSEVRVGIHEGYHRIVFDHTGAGAPGWVAEYVDEAVEPGSGLTIDMDSETILYLGVVGLEPGNAGQEDGQLEVVGWSDPQDTVFEEVATTFVHHGSASYYIGLDQEREFRVSVWEHPNGPRLIIDVLV